MDFTVVTDPCTYYDTLVCRYRDLQGNEKIKAHTLGHYDSLNNSVETVDYVKDRIRREIKQELGEQALQQQEQVMVADYANIQYQYVATNAPWQNIGTGYYGIGNQLTGGTTDLNQYVTMNTSNWSPVASSELEVEIEFPLGKRMLTMKKKADGNRIKVTMEDIDAAVDGARDQFKFNIINNRAERRAEDLLRSMISEIDFRNYKQQGFFVCRQGDKLFRIYKDKSKWVDMWQETEVNAELVWQPKNRLCTHTATRELPDADEALSKLLLARSGKLIEHSNLHSIDGTRGLIMPVLDNEDQLILV